MPSITTFKYTPVRALEGFISGDGDNPNVPFLITNAADQVLGIAGWGVQRCLPMICIGDSKTAQAFLTNTASYTSGYQPKGIVLANAELGSPFTLINGGVSGDTTLQMLERLPALLTAYPGAGLLRIRGMTNDIQSGNLVASGATGNQVTKEMIVVNLKTMLELGLAAGKAISLCTEYGSSSPFAAPVNAITAYGALQREAFAYVNTWIRQTCTAFGYPCSDIEAVMLDPATGVAVSGYLKTDGVHPSLVGGCVEATADTQAWLGLTPVPPRVSFARWDPRNLLGPSAMQVGAVTVDTANNTRIIAPATASGGIPNGWSISQFRAGGEADGSKTARTHLPAVVGNDT